MYTYLLTESLILLLEQIIPRSSNSIDHFNLLKAEEEISPYRAVNTFHHSYKNQSVNDM